MFSKSNLSRYKKCFCIPQRYILAIMGFFALVNAYTMRVVLSIAIVRMVKPINRTDHGDHAVCMADDSFDEDDTDISYGPGSNLFDWSESFQGVILSAFYYGYIITHMPGGMLAEKFGGKYVLSLGILSTALFTLLTPVVIEWGGGPALIVLRVLEGLGEGTTFPALSVMLASWIPLSERSKIGSIVFGGGQIGSIVGSALSGALLEIFDGWGSVFYCFGVIGIIWFLLFVILCYNSPEENPFIGDEEKAFLLKEMGQLERDKTLPSTPWKSIFSSVPMWALICAQIGHDWGFYTMVTDLPKYMNDVLQFSISANGVFSALPYLVMWIVSISTGFLSDWLIVKKGLSITNARKIFTGVAAVFPAIFIMLASYAGCDKVVTVVHFTIAMGFMGTFYPGMKVNPLDLSPNYAGSLMALTNGIGAITGVLAPTIVGVLTPNASLTEWRTVFWISFGIFMATTVVYSLWASGEVQSWNNPASLEPLRVDENGMNGKEDNFNEKKDLPIIDNKH